MRIDKEKVVATLRDWGLDPEIIRSLEVRPDTVTVEYYIVTSTGDKIFYPDTGEAVTSFVVYPVVSWEKGDI